MANPLIAGALVKLSANQIKRALKNLGNYKNITDDVKGARKKGIDGYEELEDKAGRKKIKVHSTTYDGKKVGYETKTFKEGTTNLKKIRNYLGYNKGGVVNPAFSNKFKG